MPNDNHSAVFNAALIVDMYRKMSPYDKAVLAKWEKENLGNGKTVTSDWPGWAEMIKKFCH